MEKVLPTKLTVWSYHIQHKGLEVTLARILFMYKTIHRASTISSSIALETISDGYDEGGIVQAETIQAYLERFRKVESETLIELVEKMNGSGFPVGFIVYDSFLLWALDVAKKSGIVGAVFFTQSCVVDSILYHVHTGSQVSLPGLTPLEPQDMPSFSSDLDSYPAFFDMDHMVVHCQFATVDKADWVLCNTFYELEEEAGSTEVYLASLQLTGSETMTKLIGKFDGTDQPVTAIVYDGFLPWVLDVAKKFRLLGVVFFTQTCAVSSIYYHVHRGFIKLPFSGTNVSVPELPLLQVSETPSFVYDMGSAYPAAYELLVNQFSNVDNADWVLFNTFYKLEEKVGF
ncbi:hypothetical protein Ddye_018581 [Dipteronia dyeriana]|uniref:Uncharacterized protein n=1 Tax=Dipteronia dyeriana TaxID=168575 RepID=A0AAD9X200_9ROSI|nr:hypothetical protein Ddye_018581 [Dipteronia dyeriana]